jgi:hypothetical protein
LYLLECKKIQQIDGGASSVALLRARLTSSLYGELKSMQKRSNVKDAENMQHLIEQNEFN